MTLVDQLVDSWRRQCSIVEALLDKVDEGNKNAKPSEDGFSLAEQFAHIHLVRKYWLK